MKPLFYLALSCVAGPILAGESKLAEASQELLDIVGDTEYGAYLAGECTGCHSAAGASDGIPAITGWDQDTFRYVMHDYRVRYLENPTMQMIAGRLGDDEIAALSAYFETLGHD